jgi:hypothetical protein
MPRHVSLRSLPFRLLSPWSDNLSHPSPYQRVTHSLTQPISSVNMSVSSATTLISPATTTSHTTMQRSNSQHGHKRHQAHAHHGHGHTKRRPSAHAAHTTGHLGTGRRGSEGDGGRKAILHGLTMHTMDGKGKKAEEVSLSLAT